MKTIRRRRPAWAAFLLALVCLGATSAPPSGIERGPVRRAAPVAAAETEARVIVKYKADSSLMRALSIASGAQPPQHAQALSARMGLSLVDGRVVGPRTQVVRGSGLSSRDLAARLMTQGDVEYAAVDGRKQALAVPNDPLYPGGQTTVTPAVGQWYLRAPTSTTIVDATSVLSSINAEAAWDITNGDSNVVVAVLDTGVRKDHPDLASKLLAGYDFISSAGISNDGDGRDGDASDPGDFDSKDGSTWHGTQTSGLIGAATNNGTGMASVGRNVTLLPVRVLGVGGGNDSDIQAAIRWAAGIPVAGVPNNTHPAKVINMSLGSSTTTCDPLYQDAIADANAQGTVVVVAAGNDGLAVGEPANCPGVIAVAGVRHAGTKVGYSDLGPQISIAAPAGNCVNASGACLFPILTTSNSGTTRPVAGAAGAIYTGGGANASLGTSFSAPLVSGTAALMFSVNPSLTPAQVKAVLQSTARTFPSSGAAPGDDGTGTVTPVRACTAPTIVAQGSECYCTTSTCGAGLLDAGAAVAAAGAFWANIAVTPANPLISQPVSLSATASTPAGNAGAGNYSWQVISGPATLTAANGPTATLLPSAAGSVVIRLTVDNGGKQAVTLTTLSISGAPVASIALPASAPAAGSSFTLDGSSSQSSPTGSLTISSYRWTITGGAGNASLSGDATAPKVALNALAAGNVTATLTVTDSANQQNTTSQSVAIDAGPGGTTSSGGGGAMQPVWLLAWLAAVIGVWAVTPRGRRRG